MIYFTSDLHFCHDREFLYRPRGFDDVEEMNNTIVTRWNNLVIDTDEVYVLGDIMLNDNELGIKLLNSLKGKIHIIFGNHDTEARKQLYSNSPNVVDTKYADMVKYAKYHFYLSHYPTFTGNMEKESLRQMTLNLFGHTHSREKFYNDIPFMYNVALDAHNNTPVSIETIIEDMHQKVKECKDFL